MDNVAATPVTVRTVGGPTVIIELGGMRIVADPTFDEPGTYELGGGRTLTKTDGPAVPLDSIGTVDLVLLSHDQHADNLDRTGRELLASASVTLTTALGAERLGYEAVGMEPWSTTSFTRPDGETLLVTAVPAVHGPPGTEHLTGPVIGFVLRSADLPVVYISGDNASLDAVRLIADRFPHIESAIVFAGAARTALLGDAYLTLTSDQTVEVARIMRNARIIPVHCDGWLHFTEHEDSVVAAFERAHMLDRLVRIAHGEHFTIQTAGAAGERVSRPPAAPSVSSR